MHFHCVWFWLLTVLLLVQQSTVAHELSETKAGTHDLRIELNDHAWRTRLYVPEKLTLYNNAPAVVLILHGAGGNGEIMLEQNGWREQATKSGFVAIAPYGIPAFPDKTDEFLSNPRLWNSGQLPAQSARAQIDDISFIKRLIASVNKALGDTEPSWFVTGHSNGAGLTFKLAVEMPDQWTAIAPVAGPLAVTAKQLPSPIPTLYILGTLDPLQPLKGGDVLIPWGTMSTTPVDEIVNYWCDANGCHKLPIAHQETETVKKQDFGNESKTIIRTVYIKGHGHRWPGGRHGEVPLLFQHFIGPVKADFNATAEIWSFFETQLPESSQTITLGQNQTN